MLQLLGSQRLKYALPKDADLFKGDVSGYPKFIAKFTTDVMEVKGVTDAEKYSALQDRTHGEAREIVDTYVYLKSKSEALKKALEELQFYYGSKKGSVQSSLTKVTEGKEVGVNSVEEVKGLLLELQKLSAYAIASGESSFLELEATVVSILMKRFSTPLRSKFSDESLKAENKGETINVAFVISFLKDHYKKINRTFGMGSLSNTSSKSGSSNPSTSTSSSP